MAEVFLARTRNDGFEKRVVIKSVLPAFHDDAAFDGMLLNEARIVASLDHANIVQVVDLFEAEGRRFIVMEFLDGQNTRQMVRRAIELGCRLSPPVVCRIIADVLAGLEYAHDLKDPDGNTLGLVHRDVSLANIVVTWSGAVKLIDFGVAKLTAGGDQQLTRAGQLKGKCAYMSPEQIRCQPLDRRTDLFSLGVVFWELLTQRRLFARRSELDSLKAICDQDAMPLGPLVKDLPRRLDEICAKALARDRDARYQTAGEMRDAIEELILAQGWNASSRAVQREMAALFRSENASTLSAAPPAQIMVLDEDALEPVLQVEPPPLPPIPTIARANESRELALLRQHRPDQLLYDTGPATSIDTTAAGGLRRTRRSLLFAAVLLGVAATLVVTMLRLIYLLKV